MRAPPRDFEPEEAMHLIFELGMSIAEAPNKSNTERWCARRGRPVLGCWEGELRVGLNVICASLATCRVGAWGHSLGA